VRVLASRLSAARTTAGSSAEAWLRSASVTIERSSGRRRGSAFAPLGSATAMRIGLAASRFASVVTSSAKLPVAARQRPSEQNAASVAGMAWAVFALNGSGSSGGRTESRSRRSTCVGCASAYHRELRAVRDAAETDLVEAERLLDGISLRVSGRRVKSRGALIAVAQVAAAARSESAVFAVCSVGQSSRFESPVLRSS
jgi:hypothetical protein